MNLAVFGSRDERFGGGEIETAIHPLDMLRACRWSRALFGTYALSLGFFEAAPLHALRRAGANDIRILADVSGVAGALGEAGAREVGRSYAVDPVLVDKGCFHTKFMLLEGEDGPRMAIGSGNLTFGGWGRNLELVEFFSPGAAPTAFADMADFLLGLGSTERVTSLAQSTLASWSTSLRSIRGDEGPRVLHNLDISIAEQIVTAANALGGARRLVVASPYFGRARAVFRLTHLLGLEKVHVHVPGRLPLGGEQFDFLGEPAGIAVVVEELEERTSRAMHAKMIEVVCADATLRISGSVNASGPALVATGNVELAVVRTVERQLAYRATDLPPPGSRTDETAADEVADQVLTAVLVGKRLSGQILAQNCSGIWAARLDATGEFRDLGEAQVGEDNRFHIDIAAADEIGFGARRAILLLQRPGRRVSGFVTFPDLIELSRRYGARAGSLMRVVNGSDEDEDLAGALEYLASQAESSLAPWRSKPNSGGEKVSGEDERIVSLNQLDLRPRAETEALSSDAGGAGAMERLLAALRRTVSIGRPGRGRSTADEEDDNPSGSNAPEGTERTDGIFSQLCEVLEGRVPDDPVPELHRLADLGVFVLSRRPDTERVAEFASWWSRLAGLYLRCPADRLDLRLTATVFLLIDALPRREMKSARYRLASIVGGNLTEILSLVELGQVSYRLERLIDEGTAGREALASFARDVIGEASTLEELPILKAAILSGEIPPSLPSLDPTPEMASVRGRIASGHASRIQFAARSAKSCPKCGVGLPHSDIERFRSLGLVIPGNCCARVIVADMELG